MTTLDIAAPSTVAPSAPTVWVQVSDDLWTANTGGDFLGTVEKVGDRYLSVDDHGMPLGASLTLELAKLRLLCGPGRTSARIAEAVEREGDRMALVTAWVAGIVTVATVVMLLAGFTA